jgi:porin
MKTITRNLLFATLLLGAFVQTTQAQTSTPAEEKDSASEKSIWTRDKLTGDWGGLRSDLITHGVSVDLRLTQVVQEVTSGGAKRGGQYGGLMDYIVNIDGKKAGLWDGVTFNMHATTRWGEDISSYTGPLALATTPLLYPLPGDYNGTDITGLAAYQAFPFFGGVGQAFFGMLNVIDLVDGLLPQTTHGGVEGFMNVNALATAMPWFRFVNLSQWGGGAWAVKDGMPYYGVIVIGQENTSTNSNWSSSWDDGVGLVGFFRQSFKLDDKDGYALFVIGGSTREYNSLDPTDWDVIPGEGLGDTETHKPIDFAAYWYQVLWQGSNKSDVHMLIGGTVADDNPSFSDATCFGSLEAFGVLGSRPRDRMGVSAWYTHVTSNVKDLTDDLGLDYGNIWGSELYYNYELTPWSHLTADLQLLQNANNEDDLAVVTGLRLVIDL